jgi:hypothetical protein
VDSYKSDAADAVSPLRFQAASDAFLH